MSGRSGPNIASFPYINPTVCAAMCVVPDQRLKERRKKKFKRALLRRTLLKKLLTNPPPREWPSITNTTGKKNPKSRSAHVAATLPLGAGPSWWLGREMKRKTKSSGDTSQGGANRRHFWQTRLRKPNCWFAADGASHELKPQDSSAALSDSQAFAADFRRGGGGLEVWPY